MLHMLLMGCSHNVVVNDMAKQCVECEKPKKPYTDFDVANFLVCQNEIINKCRALLGNRK